VGISVWWLNRQGGLASGAVTRWSYPGVQGVTNAPLTGASRAEATRLQLTIGAVSAVVQLVRQDRHLGGSEAFFLSPCCGTVRRFLYLDGNRLACRVCAGLQWRIKGAQQWAPALYRVGKLRRRLGADPTLFGPLPPRPQYCRRDHHARWVAELLAVENKARASIHAMLEAAERREKSFAKSTRTDGKPGPRKRRDRSRP
jgi:hypothetical protein